MKHFVVVLTQEGRFRFAFMQKEHGLLYDKKERKSYAIIREPYPTNWPGKWSRIYFVHESMAQTAHLDAPQATEAASVLGASVEVREPLNMVARLPIPGPRGEDGTTRELWLTAESIYDRTQSVQVRRLGNRRIQWFHALLFVCLGVAICLALVAAIAMFSGGGASDEATTPPAVQINSGTGTLVTTPEPTAPAQQPQIVVRPTMLASEPAGGS